LLFPLLEAYIPPQNEPSIPTLPVPAQLHSSTAATTDQNAYIPHTTTFWNSGAQFHPGIVPSYPPPAPPTSIQQRNSRPKRLPTYIQQHSGILIASSIPEWSQNQSSLPPPLPTTPSHSSTPTQPTKAPAYLPITTFWNSGGQFHSGIISQQQTLEN
jgi:hypothetical protein